MRAGDASSSALARGDAAGAAAWALRLAFGEAAGGDAIPYDWERVLTAAAHERCAALAWHRSGAWIREHAPAATVARWRTLAIDAAMRGRAQWTALHDVHAALTAARLSPVALKGLPLAQRLYGDPFVRSVADSDVYVPVADRARAREVLTELGWRHVDGEAPWEESWRLGAEPRPLHLEVHSSLFDQNLAHLGHVQVAAEPVTIEGETIRAHGGAFLAGYLASHLAKHRMPPLLWFVDIATLVDGLGPAALAEARDAAAAHGLRRYLEWAIAGARAAREGASGSARALRVLGYRGRERRDGHPAIRDLRLADTPVAALRALAAWTWPPALRRSPSAFALRCAHRVRHAFVRHPASAERYGAR